MKKEIGDIFSAKVENAKREYPEDPVEIRTEFDRDKDRILYSRAFRRLSGKTQVFVSGKDDHIRNRLSHTLEVSQIARTISKYLGLNENLTEAIALGHDIGHTPFGHVGERTLNLIMNGCDELRNLKDCLNDDDKGFKHNWQSIRVVTDLESRSNKVKGLNLTQYTLWGILNHSKLECKKCKEYNIEKGICTFRQKNEKCNNANQQILLKFYEKYKNAYKNSNLTIEGLIVGIADEIAQRHHDVEDALLVKIIRPDELIDKIIFCYGNCEDNSLEEIKDEKDVDIQRVMLGSYIVNMLTRRVIYNIKEKLESYIDLFGIKTSEDFEVKKRNEDFIRIVKKDIDFDEELSEKDKEFQDFIKNRILNSYTAQLMDGKGNFIIRELFKAFLNNPQQLPDKTIVKLFSNLKEKGIQVIVDKNNINVGELRNKLQELHSGDSREYKVVLMRTICDYISGMTDKFALEVHSELYLS